MRIAVIGVGNIGMRYVQGINKSFPAADLFLVDSAARMQELAALNMSNVTLLTSLDDMPDAIDIIAVATSCEPRLQIYKRCLALKPRYVILEKYLFKSRQEFEECLQLDRVPTYVNQWMYGSRAFDQLFESDVESVRLSGSGWGLACNAVHWIDVFKRHMRVDKLRVGEATSVSKVFPSKRPGYEEIFGTLVFEDCDSEKSFALVDEGDPGLVGMQEINVDGIRYVFDFKQITHGDKIVGQFPYLSEVIGGITGDILQYGSCHLPTLEESVAQHLLIEDILDGLDRRPKIT